MRRRYRTVYHNNASSSFARQYNGMSDDDNVIIPAAYKARSVTSVGGLGPPQRGCRWERHNATDRPGDTPLFKIAMLPRM
jgi:hypothetical protein